jgi:hypothetical protein
MVSPLFTNLITQTYHSDIYFSRGNLADDGGFRGTAGVCGTMLGLLVGNAGEDGII